MKRCRVTRVYSSLSEGGAKTELASAIGAATTSYTATGLSDGTTYYFWVKAYNTQGDSLLSNALSATPNATQPSAPQNLTVSSRGNGFVTLTWTAPSDTGGSGVPIDHYLIYADDIAQPSTSGLTATISGLTNAHTYTFRVIAVNSAATGIAATTTGTPVARTGRTHHWHQYRRLCVHHHLVGSGIVLPAATRSKATTCILRSQAPQIRRRRLQRLQALSTNFDALDYAEYTMWVVSYNGYATSDPSTRVTNRPAYVAPSAPTGVSASVGGSTIMLTWASPADIGGAAITNYKITYSVSGSPVSVRVDAPALSKEIAGLPSGSYTFTITASNDGGAHYGTAATSGSVYGSMMFP